MDKTQAVEILKRNFGFNDFKENQWDIISKILNGQKLLLVAKTGFGKSLCYQFPATIFDGITLVFSPLIALMRNQVSFLNEKGIPAATLNSNHSEDIVENEKINKKILKDAVNGKYKILYIAPERIENEIWRKYLPYLNISMVVVDEAHCISVWGHDFRPDYRRIIEIVKLLPKKIPVFAVTATADDFIAKDIKKQIQKDGEKVEIVKNNLYRNNLRLRVVHANCEEEKLVFLKKYLKKSEGTGIVYSATISKVGKYAAWLKFNGIDCAYYHSKVSNRREIEKAFFDSKCKCIVSTTALGMGIDKEDIRFIIHTEIPGSIIQYYQEIGRAGRDGKESDIILLYNKKDLEIQKYFIEQSKPSISKYERVIRYLKDRPSGEREIIIDCNLTRQEFRVIREDLRKQGAIVQVESGKDKRYEYNPNARYINYTFIEGLKKYKSKRLDDMAEYVYTKECRMKYICNYLGDQKRIICGKCDNDINDFTKRAGVLEEDKSKLKAFYSCYHPVLRVGTKNGILINGVAAGEYGDSEIGMLIHKSKYENGGYFPDNLVDLTYKAFMDCFKNVRFDCAVSVPPTKSGDLVENFAKRLCKKIGIPLRSSIIKIKQTKEQKVFRNGYAKKNNLKGAFCCKDSWLAGKNVLIIDDVFDSGATIKEIADVLKKAKVKLAAPITIAKTVGQ